METIITAKNIQKKYQEITGDESVLCGIDLTVTEGEFVVIMGPSGAGKSTLLYALSGLEPIDGGEVRYLDRPIHTLSEKELAALRASDFGFVFQQPQLIADLTLRDNVLLSGLLSGKDTDEQVAEQADALLERMEIKELGNRLPSQVSGGEAQRAQIARAMIKQPAILFADEPTGALNRRNTDMVLDIFTQLHEEGQTIVMVTHDISCAARGERLLYLEDGAIRVSTETGRYAKKSTADQKISDIQKTLKAFRW